MWVSIPQLSKMIQCVCTYEKHSDFWFVTIFISEIIQAKLDQSQSLLEVDTTIGRDIRPENTDVIKNTLESWCEACETVLQTLQTQVDRANIEKTARIQKKEQQEQEVSTRTSLVQITYSL